MPDIEPGASGSVTITVGPADLADTLGPDPEDRFPAVLATARMVALMEAAAARVLRPLLAEGELSVGVTVDVNHTAATPPGARVSAHARYTGREDRLYVFEVWAEDAGGVVGRGVHRRAIVATGRLLASAARRNPPEGGTG